ncbi:MAG TPA: glutathione S-transferase N-terminal domain-containing protein [Candidatus Aquilonibacter sp.]
MQRERCQQRSVEQAITPNGAHAHHFLEETLRVSNGSHRSVVTGEGRGAGPRKLTRMTDTNIVLYQAEWCPYCARVRARMTDLLLDYKIVNEPEDHGQRTNLKELFGVTGIPSMTDGDVKIADDDDAIIEYLDKKYGKQR